MLYTVYCILYTVYNIHYILNTVYCAVCCLPAAFCFCWLTLAELLKILFLENVHSRVQHLKIPQPLGTKKNHATSRDKKSQATSWDQKIMQPSGQKKSRCL